MYSFIIIIFIIFILLLLIGFFWYYTIYNTSMKEIKDNIVCENIDKQKFDFKKSEEQFNKLQKDLKYGITIVSNIYENNLIKSRVMNLITHDGKYYMYAPKDSNLKKELDINSNVTVCNFVYTKDLQFQAALYGNFKFIKTIETLNVYEFIISNRRISKTNRIRNSEITNNTYDNEESNKQIIKLLEIKNVILYIKTL